MKRLIHDDGCNCGRCYRRQINRHSRERKMNQTGKTKDWMDKRAEEVWQKHKDRQPDYPMYRSPLRDLT